MRKGRTLALVFAAAILAGSCTEADPTASAPTTTTTPTISAPATTAAPDVASTDAPTSTVAPVSLPERAVIEVIERRPHDPTSFTQGLELDGDDLIESSGLPEVSRLSILDPVTNEIRASEALAPELFAEGATVVGDQIYLLTYEAGIAFAVDRSTLEVEDQFVYEGEGWGLCNDGDRLVMSNGSSSLTFRSPDDFSVLGTVDVTRDGVAIDDLNELECVGNEVFANVLGEDQILRIDPETGSVLTTIEASGLLTEEEDAVASVLNGIAYDTQTGTFLLTGKYWPWLFEVEFVAA